MGDAMPGASEERALAEEGKAEAGEGEQHETIEDKAQGKTDEEQGKSGDDIEEQKNGGDEAGEDEEEPGECGFCLFMKSGPCRDSFISWEQCIEQAEKDKEDIVEKCHKVTFILKECMEHNSDYYDPVLQAEKAMGDAALEEEEEEAAAAAQGDANANPPDSQVNLQSESQPSLDAPHSQAPPPVDAPHVDTEEHHIHTEQHSIHASSEEHYIHTEQHSIHASSEEHHTDEPAEAPHPPNSHADALQEHADAQERTSA